MGLSLVKQLVSTHKMFVLSAKFNILIYWSSVYKPFYSFVIITERFDATGCYNIQKNGEWTVPQNILHDEGNGVRDDIFSFRLIIVVHKRFIKYVENINCIFKKLHKLYES